MTEELGVRPKKDLREYSYMDMSEALLRLQGGLDRVLDLAYEDLAKHNGDIDETLKTGDVLSAYYTKSLETSDSENTSMNFLQPGSEDRRIITAYFGITDEAAWKEAAEKIIHITDFMNLDRITSREVVQRTLRNMDNYTELPIHTAEITYRTYEQYLDMFEIEEEFLKGKKILDLGGGLASFTEEVNTKFKTEGTSAISLDPAYQILKDLKIDEHTDPIEVYEQFSEKLHKRSLSTLGYYGRDSDEKDYIGQKESLGDRLKHMFLHPDSQLIAGEGQKIPLANELIDLILSSNYLFRVNVAGPEAFGALQEAVRVLKKNGQILVRPLLNLVGEKGDLSMIISLFDRQGAYIEPLDEIALKNFQQLEEQGIKFYFVVTHEGDHILAVRKDESYPAGFRNYSSCKIFKLNFLEHDSSQDPIIPSTLIET